MACFVVDLDDTLVNTTRDLGGDVHRIHALTLVDGVKEFLALHGDKSIILSSGVERIQQEKIERVGLRRLVRHVVIVPSFEKKSLKLAQLAGAAKIAHCEVFVVGDRIDQEIRVGNELGCVTVRVRLVEGKYYGTQPFVLADQPDHTVADFRELLKLPLRF